MKKIPILALALFVIVASAVAEEPNPHGLLKALYDRSDLIIDATLTETCGGGMTSGPIPTDKAQLYVMSCVPQVKVNRVLKGDYSPDQPFRIGVTVPQSDKGPFDLALEKDSRYIFFLEDRHKREPDSQHEVDGEVIHYRTFDYWFSRLPATEALILQLDRWSEGGPRSLSPGWCQAGKRG